jgi:CubicO group peptidase (beta-lactamase class C family)
VRGKRDVGNALELEGDSTSPAALLDAFVAAGQCKSVQLVVRVGGRQVVSHAAGEARPGVPMTAATKVRLDCAVKPVVAMGVLWLRERGLLSTEVPVSTYIPEFACGGKETITAHHLLTHTSGYFRPKHVFPLVSSPAILKQRLFAGEICDGTPGSIAEYDIWGGWYTLAEMIERVTTVSWVDFLTEHILEPIGADALELLPVPGPDPSRLELAYWSARSGGRVREMGRLNSPEALSYPNPAYGGYAPMEALAELFSTLGQSERCRDLLGFDPAPMTTSQRPDMYDRFFKVECGMGYGMFVRLDRLNFCSQVSPATFGNYSHVGTWGMYDPDADIVIGLRMNGAPFHIIVDRTPYRTTHGHPVINAVYNTCR